MAVEFGWRAHSGKVRHSSSRFPRLTARRRSRRGEEADGWPQNPLTQDEGGNGSRELPNAARALASSRLTQTTLETSPFDLRANTAPNCGDRGVTCVCDAGDRATLRSNRHLP